MPVKKEGDDKISAFERKRLANIEANREVLTDISAAAKKVIPDKPTPKPSKSRRLARKSEPVKREPTRPTRTSSRLAGLQADDSTLKRKMEVEAEAQAELAKAKKMRVSDDLNLGDIVVEGKKWGSGIDGIKGLVRGAQPGVRTFTEDDVKETTDKELKGLRQRMSGLKLYEHWAPNGWLHWLNAVRRWYLTAIQTLKSHRSACTLLAFTLRRTSQLSLRATRRAPWVSLTVPRQPPK